MQLTKDEMETVFSFTAAERETISVFSNDSMQIRRLERAGAVFLRDIGYNTKEYTIEYRQLSIRKLAPKKVVSEEQRAKAAERLRTMQESKRTAKSIT